MADEPLSLHQTLQAEYQALRPNSEITGVNTEALYRKLADEAKPLSALCISGGGIRSATLGLGAIQSLAANGLLAQFDYISTVSGGGYIGGWLTAWIRRVGIGPVVERLADSCKRAEEEHDGEIPDPIQHLRDYNNYLTPKLGAFSFDTWTLLSTITRNIALNWLVLIPVLLFFLMLPRILYSVARLAAFHEEHFGSSEAISHHPIVTWGLPILCLGLFGMGIYNIFRYLPGVGGKDHTASDYTKFVLGPLVGSTVLYCAFDSIYYWADQNFETPAYQYIGWSLGPSAIAWVTYLIHSHFRSKVLVRLGYAVVLLAVSLGIAEWEITRSFVPRMDWDEYVTLVPPLIGAAFTAAIGLFVGMSSGVLEDEDREWLSRATAGVLLVSVGWLAICALVLLAPSMIFKWNIWGKRALMSAGAVAGWLTSRSRSEPTGGKNGFSMMALAGKVAPVVFILALMLGLACWTNLLLYATGSVQADWWDHDAFLAATPWQPVLEVAAGFATLAWFMGRYININKFSLHAMYRDRLIRAYLGASNPDRVKADNGATIEGGPNRFTGFAQSDNLYMHDLVQRPFHVANATLNLVAGQRLAWQQRKAQSFTMSPLHCGNYQLGYRPSARYTGDPGISLGSAVTISGAAASPNMGYHSSPAIGFIMTMLNARLGAWLGNPGKAGNFTWTHAGPRSAVNSLLSEAFGLTTNKTPYVYLSDGAHFENLALYEMVLRRCRTIVLLDHGADSAYTYEDLGNALRKIRIDLKVPIVFEQDCIAPLRKLDKRCAVARIDYAAVDGACDPGYLIYIKPMRHGDEPPDVASYAAAHPDFPHQSTADQWFDESQTESYRMLAKFTLDGICAGWDPTRNIGELPRHVATEYLGVQQSSAKGA